MIGCDLVFHFFGNALSSHCFFVVRHFSVLQCKFIAPSNIDDAP